MSSPPFASVPVVWKNQFEYSQRESNPNGGTVVVDTIIPSFRSGLRTHSRPVSVEYRTNVKNPCFQISQGDHPYQAVIVCGEPEPYDPTYEPHRDNALTTEGISVEVTDRPTYLFSIAAVFVVHSPPSMVSLTGSQFVMPEYPDTDVTVQQSDDGGWNLGFQQGDGHDTPLPSMHAHTWADARTPITSNGRAAISPTAGSESTRAPSVFWPGGSTAEKKSTGFNYISDGTTVLRSERIAPSAVYRKTANVRLGDGC